MKLQRLFKEHGIELTAESKLKAATCLDVSLNLYNYPVWDYDKHDDEIQYIYTDLTNLAPKQELFQELAKHYEY